MIAEAPSPSTTSLKAKAIQYALEDLPVDTVYRWSNLDRSVTRSEADFGPHTWLPAKLFE